MLGLGPRDCTRLIPLFIAVILLAKLTKTLVVDRDAISSWAWHHSQGLEVRQWYANCDMNGANLYRTYNQCGNFDIENHDILTTLWQSPHLALSGITWLRLRRSGQNVKFEIFYTGCKLVLYFYARIMTILTCVGNQRIMLYFLSYSLTYRHAGGQGMSIVLFVTLWLLVQMD